MALRKTIGQVIRATGSCRTYSSQEKLLDVAVNSQNGIATVTMQRLPINALNLELLTDLSNTFSELEKNKTRGLILTSASKSVFSAGLDILEMYKPNPDRFKQFWSALQDTFINLYGSSYPTVAVINGHAPAGGCVLSLSCEYRVMLPNFTIGLNETQLGIMAPSWFIPPMQAAIGLRETELALTAGKMYKTDEALNVGLIDEIASTKEDGLAKAETFIASFKRIPPAARALTKRALREKNIQSLVSVRDKDVQLVAALINDPQIQKGLGMYLETLKQKK